MKQGGRSKQLWGIAATVTTALTLALGATHASAAPTLPLDHAGRWITDASGRVVIVHGTNMVYKRAPYYPAAAGFGEEDASYLQSIGFNAVRVGVIWKALEPEPGVYDSAYVAHIAETVQTLAAHGILSLIDMHQDMYNEEFEGEGAPDWAVEDEGKPNPHYGFSANYEFNAALNAAMDNFWANSPGPEGIGLQVYFAQAWRYLASQLSGTSGLMGYETWNEPWPGTEWSHCAALAEGAKSKPCKTFDAKLSAMDARVASAIREADPTTPIYYEPSVLFNFGAPTAVVSPSVANVNFAFHDYCLTASPNGCPSEGVVFTNAIKHAKKAKNGLLLTEYGASNDEGDLTGMVEKADANMVPWLEWSYCLCDDPTGSPTEGLIQQATSPPSGENLNAGTVADLLEAYPQVIAGTPLAWHYDRKTHVSWFVYTPKRAAGGKFGEGAMTEIAAPAAVYPSGYSVSVAGAAVASAADAPTLVLSQQGKPKTISVTISPE